MRLYAREHATRQYPKPDWLGALTRLFEFYIATAWRTLELLRPSDRRLATTSPLRAGGGLAFADASAALVWLEAERANLLAAIVQTAAKQTQTPEVLGGLAGQLTRALYGFFQVHNYWQDGIQANQAALELARRTQDYTTQAYCHHDLGVAYRILGRYGEAIASHKEGLSVFRKLGDRYGQAASLSSLGVVSALIGRSTRAIAYLRESLSIFWELGDRRGQAASLGDLGSVYYRVGRYDDAVTYQQQSYAIFQDLGDLHGQAASLTDLGMAYEGVGRYDDALTCQRRSYAIFQDLGDRYGQAEALRDLGDALRAIGRDHQAQEAWQEALAHCESLQIPEAKQVRARLAALPPDSPRVANNEERSG